MMRYRTRTRARGFALRAIACVFFLAWASTSAPGQCVVEERKLTAPDAAPADRFGTSVSVSGDVAVVGVPMDDDTYGGSGSAYVYRFDGTNWLVEQKLVASDPGSLDYFGYSASVSEHVIVVGAYKDDAAGTNSGSAYVYRFDGSSWVEEQKLVATDAEGFEHFGVSVSVSGTVAVVGAHRDDDIGRDSGSAYIYRYDGSTWVEEQKLVASDGAPGDAFGLSVSVSANVALVGAYSNDHAGDISGAAYAYRFDGSIWVEEQKLVASDAGRRQYFGCAVSVNANVAVVGACYDNPAGSAYVYRFDGASWVEEQKLVPSDTTDQAEFGSSVSVDGDVVVVGAQAARDEGTYTGAAYVYRLAGDNTWEELKLVASDATLLSFFGCSVSTSGDVVLVGAEFKHDEAGSAYLFSATHPGTCQLGTVDVGGSSMPADVMMINGETGGSCVERIVSVQVGAPIEIFMDAPPSGPNPAIFALYLWKGEPDGSTDSPQPLQLGTMCFPSYLTSGDPKPARVWNNAGHEPLLGKPDFPSQPAPSTVLSRTIGWHRSMTVTLQGFIVDHGSAAEIPGSVTNAIVLKIVE